MRPRGAIYKALGCIPFQNGGPSFALPVFERTSDGDKFFVQEIDEVTNLVSDFKILEDAVVDNLVAANGPDISIGSNVVYAFIDEFGNLHIGSVFKLKMSLRAFVQRCPDQAAIVLQIEELIGEPNQKRRARTKMREVIKNSIGEQSAYAFYEIAVLRAAFWQLLVEFVGNLDAARRIISVRSRLDVGIEPGGAFRFNLEALSPEDQSFIDTEALGMALREQFEPLVDSVVSEPAEEELSHENFEDRINQVLKTLAMTGRQEERIAIILDEIVKDRSIGLAALRRYKSERGQWANSAIKLISLAFLAAESSINTDQLKLPLPVGYALAIEDDEAKVAAFVQPLFSSQYTLARGELLFYLAKHLAKWPKINQAIRSKLDSSHAVFVDNFRPSIVELLERSSKDDAT